MARIRTIKPEFWTSEKVAECSPTARLLFVGIWTFADDGGVHQDSAKRLKMEVFPADDFTADQVRELLQELVTAGLIMRFEAEGQSYLWVTGWHHQKIDRPTYRHPPPPLADGSTATRRVADEASPIPPPRNGVESSRVEGSRVESTSIDRRADRSKLRKDFPKTIVERGGELYLQHREKYLALATSMGNGRAMSDVDRDDVIRFVLLGAFCLPAGVLDDVVKRVELKCRRDPADKKLAYLRRSLLNECESLGIDFHKALDSFKLVDEQEAVA